LVRTKHLQRTLNKVDTKKDKYLDGFVINDCCILSKDTFTITATKETKKDIWTEWPVAHIVSYYDDDKKKGDNDPWGGVIFKKNNLKWPRAVHSNKSTFFVLDNEGRVFHAGFGKGNKYREKQISPHLTGSIENIQNIHGTIYAVGINRAVIRREGRDKWTLISKEIKEQAEEKLDVFQAGFNSIDGFNSTSDLYAGGGHSDMWHYDGKVWRGIDIPVLRMRIHAVVCAGDEQVYAVGRFGTIVQGRGDRWKAIKQDLTQSDFNDAVWYEDRLYLCTTSNLYELKDGELKETNFNSNEVPFTFGHLYANDGLLMSAGKYSIAIYNGKEWDILHGASSYTQELENTVLSKMLDDAEKTVEAAGDVLDALKDLPKK